MTKEEFDALGLRCAVCCAPLEGEPYCPKCSGGTTHQPDGYWHCSCGVRYGDDEIKCDTCMGEYLKGPELFKKYTDSLNSKSNV